MPDENLTVQKRRHWRYAYKDFSREMRIVRVHFLKAVKDDRSVHIHHRRHRTDEELADAMIELNRSGSAEELLKLDPKVSSYYNFGYASVFIPYMNSRMEFPYDSFAMELLETMPESYRSMRKRWNQLPAFKTLTEE